MNIMITTKCNLACGYCFAKNIGIEGDMSLDNFQKCLAFVSQSKGQVVRLIGGEPTLHPNFSEFLKLIVDSHFAELHIFSNCIMNDEALASIIGVSKTIRILIIGNLNGSEICGSDGIKRYDCVIGQLKQVGIDVTVGMNIYTPNMSFDYFFDIVKRQKIQNIRLSIAVLPMPSIKKAKNYYQRLINKYIDFLSQAYALGCSVENDCNSIPLCYYSSAQQEKVRKLYPELLIPTKCAPSIDILPNLDVIRCFACKTLSRINLDDASNASQMLAFFSCAIDRRYDQKVIESCRTCNYKKTCRPACLGVLSTIEKNNHKTLTEVSTKYNDY